MNRLNTTTLSLVVTPTVLSTLVSHYLHRKALRERPTAHLSYDEGLHLIRSFLDYAAHHTVEELQTFTARWVPHPQWVKVDEVAIADDQLLRAAVLLEAQLGPEGIRSVGGRHWWRWRLPKAPLQAEWIEMRAHALQRKKANDPGRRVIMYIHGGAHFFGSVDEHRYQMQRHARKLKARVLAPRYRLAPQFPFPCGLQDCLAAYLFLLALHDPSTIVLAGDSAGGGTVVSLLCLLRDQGLPLPAGAVLISPWVDLTHSFPSLTGDASLDYIPQAGFHHKPSRAWPPPEDDNDDVASPAEAGKTTDGEADTHRPPLTAPENEPVPAPTSGTGSADADKYLTVTIDGEPVTIRDQIQMYTTNALLSHPLVSPVMQPTLGGLPPLMIMVGGGEILRDEQIYLAHKCANPAKYALPQDALTDKGRKLLARYKPTDVQLQVWDHLCHVAPTLSFTRPAKYMYRSIAQFGAWALARAQETGIEILDDDISVITSSGSDSESSEDDKKLAQSGDAESGQVGKAGDPLPPFKKHMIRQRVTRHGVTLPLAPESELPGCCMDPADVGVIKEGPVKRWMATKRQWDAKYSATKAKVQRKIAKDAVAGFQKMAPNERPPPSALAGRRRIHPDLDQRKKSKSLGLALWSLWGFKHDEVTVEREHKAGQEAEAQAVTGDEGRGVRPYGDIAAQQPAAAIMDATKPNRATSCQGDQLGTFAVDQDAPVTTLFESRHAKEQASGLPSPTYVPENGVAGKRPFIGGIAMPFSLNKRAETASMMTLNLAASPAPSAEGPRLDNLSGHVAAENALRAEQMSGGMSEQSGRGLVSEQTDALLPSTA